MTRSARKNTSSKFNPTFVAAQKSKRTARFSEEEITAAIANASSDARTSTKDNNAATKAPR